VVKVHLLNTAVQLDTAFAAVGAVIERITGSAAATPPAAAAPTVRPAAPTVIRRSAERRLIPVGL